MTDAPRERASEREAPQEEETAQEEEAENEAAAARARLHALCDEVERLCAESARIERAFAARPVTRCSPMTPPNDPTRTP